MNMEVKVSGVHPLNKELYEKKCEGITFTTSSYKDWLSDIISFNDSKIYVWIYMSPWEVIVNSSGYDVELAEWNKVNKKVLEIERREKNKILFLDSNMKSLDEIIRICKKESFFTPPRKNQDEILFLQVLNKWGNAFYNTYLCLESKLPTEEKINFKKQSQTNSALTDWREFFKEKNTISAKLKKLESELSERYIELAKLTALLESKENKAELYKNELNVNKAEGLGSKKLIVNEAEVSLNTINEANYKKKYIEKDLQIKLSELQDSIKQRFNELAKLTDLLELSERKNLLKDKQIENLSARYDYLKNTFSWRITSPLRQLKKIFPRKNKNEKKSISINKAVELIESTDLFNKTYYLSNNPDVALSGINAAKHYLLYGGFEGRDPSPLFSSQYYLDIHEDVRLSGINPLEHYLRFGQSEKRLISISK